MIIHRILSTSRRMGRRKPGMLRIKTAIRNKQTQKQCKVAQINTPCFVQNVEIKNFQRPEIDVDAQNSNLPYIDTSKKIKDGFVNGTSWTATEDCIVCGSIGFNSSAQGCNVLINGINIFWVNNDVTVNSAMSIWFSVRKGDTVRFVGYNNQVPNLFPVLTVIKIIPDTGVVKCD